MERRRWADEQGVTLPGRVVPVGEARLGDARSSKSERSGPVFGHLESMGRMPSRSLEEEGAHELDGGGVAANRFLEVLGQRVSHGGGGGERVMSP